MSKLNRREFLERAAVLGAGIGLGAFVIGCNSGGSASFTCTDTTGLSEDEIAMRTTQAYVDTSTDAAKNCANCIHYSAAAEGACGTCAVLKGGVHPAGNCNLWMAQA